MGLSAEQRKVGRQFAEALKDTGASPLVQKALYAAGLVEANLGNPNYGDRDSIGSLQERSHYGSAERRLNPYLAARRFIGEAQALQKKGFKGSAGNLAQAVQRSAFPERYDQRGSEADRLRRVFLRGAAGGDAQNGAQRPPAGTNTPDPGPATIAGSSGGGEGLTTLLQQLTQKQQAPPVSSLQEPAFSARASLARPQGAPPPLQSSAPAGPSGPSTDETLELIRALTGGEGPSVQAPDVPEAQMPSSQGGSRAPTRNGAGRDTGGLGGGSGLFELFYDPLGGWKHGKSIGAIGGHSDHIHVAAGPKTLRRIAEAAQKAGLRVGEFEPYDKVDPVHTGGSYHYRNRAADISGDPRKMRAFTQQLREAYGLE